MFKIMIVVLLALGLIINMVREFNLVNYQKLSFYITKKEILFLVFVMFQTVIIGISLFNIFKTSASLFQSVLFLAAFLVGFGAYKIAKFKKIEIIIYIVIPFLVLSSCISILRYYNITSYIDVTNIIILSSMYILFQLVIFQKIVNNIIENVWREQYENKNN